MDFTKKLKIAVGFILGFALPALTHGQTYSFSGTANGWTEVDLSFGFRSYGGSPTYFGAVNETFYYDPIAGTCRYVGSVIINPTNVNFNMSDDFTGYHNFATGKASLAINGGSSSLAFDSRIFGWNGVSGVIVQVSGSCNVIYNGRPYSGYVSYTMDLSVGLQFSVTPSNLTFYQYTVGNGVSSGIGHAVGGIGLTLMNSSSDSTYHYYWQLSGVANLVPTNSEQVFISGRITNSGGVGIGGVTVNFSNGGGMATTDSNGYYTNSVPYGWSVMAVPFLTGQRFSPSSRSYSNVMSNQSAQEYTGTVLYPPSILMQPTNVTLGLGGAATFSVVATGSPSPSYQWYRQETALLGRTNANLQLSAVTQCDAGTYKVVVENPDGTVTSSGALLTVVTPIALTGMNINNCAFNFILHGTAGSSLVIQTSSNLIDWASLSTCMIPAIGAAAITDSGACGRSARFYRAMVPVGPVEVVAWGQNNVGQTNIPLGLTNVVAIAGGFYHSLALKADGTVVGWGENDFGQTNPPVGLTNATAITAGWGTSLALKSDGTLEEWGWYGNIGQYSTARTLTSIKAISACWDCLMALKCDGTVVVFGKSTHGEIDVPSGLTGVVSIAGGGYHCLALKGDGTVVAWGDNSYGQISVPSGLTDVKAIAAGSSHSLVLKNDGKVIAWGKNSNGQTNVPPTLTNVIAISGGFYHSLALTSDGKVVGWGDNSSGQTNSPAGLTNATAISAGGYHNLSIGR